MKTVPPSFRILIPSYNPGVQLPDLLRRIGQEADPSCVIIVDDGSTDGSAGAASGAGCRVIRHEKNSGKGAALRTGMAEALRETAVEAIITMDADGQHDPADLAGFVRAWQRDHADLVIGDRHISGSAMPLHRRVSNSVTSFLVSQRTGIRIPDSQCGYRLVSRRLAGRIRPRTDGFEAETEMIIRAVLAGFSVASVPVRTVYGPGPSHMKNWMTTKAFVRVLLQEHSWVD